MKKILLLLVCLLIPTISFAQFRIITGKVWGFAEGAKNAEVLPGATIVQTTTNNGTQTDAQGWYSLRLVASLANPTQFTASHIGYTSKTQDITNSDYCNFILFEEPASSPDTREEEDVRMIQYNQDEKKKE